MEKTAVKWTPENIPVGLVAKRCGVSNTTVLRWINTGQLPAFRLPGGHFRINVHDFTIFLQKHNMPAPGESAEKHQV